MRTTLILEPEIALQLEQEMRRTGKGLKEGVNDELRLGLGTAGNLTTDAHLAALAIEHQCELCSTDSDFLRFPGLRWTNPLTAR